MPDLPTPVPTRITGRQSRLQRLDGRNECPTFGLVVAAYSPAINVGGQIPVTRNLPEPPP